MKAWRLGWTLATLMLVGSTVDAQTSVRIRGTIATIDGNALAVKSRDGRDLRIQLADNVTVAVAKAIRFEDIRPGDYVGATTRPGPDGAMVALEVHYLASTVPEGQIPWDLEPDTIMTSRRGRCRTHLWSR